ncbi:MAG: hypothetical protein IJ055_00550 [Oscillospiraceae bacterium]|nr:hypothetical protein [Oscillospiraceae bacterium]
MSYRDKMIILIITIIIILVGGFFALIRPRYNALINDTATLVTTQAEWEGLEAKINQIPVLQDTITTMYNEAKSTASMFVDAAYGDANETYDTDKISYYMDQYIQPALDDSELEVSSIDLSAIGSEDVEYYYYTPNVLTYSLLETGDVNGNYAKEVNDEILRDSNYLTEKNVASMQVTTVTMTVEGTKESLMTFLDAIHSDKNAILVSECDIANYQFKEDEEVIVSVDEEGNETRTVVGSNDEDGTSAMTLVVKFYNAKEIDEPDLGE